jgi:hypothetical protein
MNRPRFCKGLATCPGDLPEGLLYQSIEEAGGSNGEELGGARRFFVVAGHGTPAPKHGHRGKANEGGCPADSRGKSFLSLSEFYGSVVHDAETVGKWTQKTIHKVWDGIKKALGYKNPTGHDAACAAFGVGVNLVLKDSPFVTTNAVGVAATLGCAAFLN